MDNNKSIYSRRSLSKKKMDDIFKEIKTIQMIVWKIK